MKITPTMVKKKLDTAVADIAKVGWLYTRDPGIDFTRKRKLPIESMLHLMLKFCGKSLQGEISAYYSSTPDILSADSYKVRIHPAKQEVALGRLL